MEPSEQRARAERLHALHRGPRMLVLPNARDVASALVFARSPSCRAIGTTSWGIAALPGRPDGELVSRDEMLDMVGRIAAAVDVPVTAGRARCSPSSSRSSGCEPSARSPSASRRSSSRRPSAG